MKILKKILKRIVILLIIAGLFYCGNNYIFPALGIKLNIAQFEAAEVEYITLASDFLPRVTVAEPEDIETIINELNNCTLQGFTHDQPLFSGGTRLYYVDIFLKNGGTENISFTFLRADENDPVGYREMQLIDPPGVKEYF